jgi:hypothetical protein
VREKREGKWFKSVQLRRLPYLYTKRETEISIRSRDTHGRRLLPPLVAQPTPNPKHLPTLHLTRQGPDHTLVLPLAWFVADDASFGIIERFDFEEGGGAAGDVQGGGKTEHKTARVWEGRWGKRGRERE